MENKEFLEKYTYMFKNLISKYQKRYNVPNCNVILAKDCSRSNIWRKDIFPDYKKNRDDRNNNKFNSCIFKYTYSVIIQSIQEKSGCKILEINRAEADDIIALCKTTIHSINPSTKIFIVSNDKDYIQLIDNVTQVVDMKCLPLTNNITSSPTDYLLAKIILGDKSDNIPPISKRIGKKKALLLVNNPQELDKLLKNEQIRQQYELNKQLIDFTFIPISLKSHVKKKLDELIKRKKQYFVNYKTNKPFAFHEKW
jgi:5'-3' exonuclease